MARSTLCSKCKRDNDRLPQRYCTSCHAERMRLHRRTHALSDEARWKDNVRSHAHLALRRGQITREPCAICGAEAEMHHEDYSRHLDVIWLCRAHHLARHRAIEDQELTAFIREMVSA